MTDYPLIPQTALRMHPNDKWDDIKDRSLKNLIRLDKLPPAQNPILPDFASAIRAANDTPIGQLGTSDLLAVTGQLMQKLRDQPGAFDGEFIALLKQAWTHHAEALEHGDARMNASQKDLHQLAENIAAIVPRKHDLGEKLPEPLEWTVRIDLKKIRDVIDTMARDYNNSSDMAESREDSLLHWVNNNFKDANWSKGHDMALNLETYRARLPASQHGRNNRDIAAYLLKNGACKVSSNDKTMTITPQSGSSLHDVLEVVANYNRGRSLG